MVLILDKNSLICSSYLTHGSYPLIDIEWFIVLLPTKVHVLLFSKSEFRISNVEVNLLKLNGCNKL